MIHRLEKYLAFYLALFGGSVFGADGSYHQDFEKEPTNQVPADLLVLGGDFTVQQADTNKFLALPGSPLESFGVQFGPSEKSGAVVSARILGTSHGRRSPVFGVGVFGLEGFKLRVVPAKNTIELIQNQEIRATAAWAWKTGTWTLLKLEAKQQADKSWIVRAKAWKDRESEPIDWSMTASIKDFRSAGRSSIFGSPFAGTPIWFDDLAADRVSN